MSFSVEFPTRWADFDPNNHMRHSAYNDYAAEARARFFKSQNLSLAEFSALMVGPVLFREETNFLREISMGENINVETILKGMSDGGERFMFFHKIFKENGILAAEITVLGAWMDLKKRKLTIPPPIVINACTSLERTEEFNQIPLSRK